MLGKCRKSANLKSLGILAPVGFGLCFSSSIDAVQALLSDRVWVFSSKPKYAIRGTSAGWKDKAYQLPISGKSIVEACLPLAGMAALAFALADTSFVVALFLLVYSSSFALIATLNILQCSREVGA